METEGKGDIEVNRESKERERKTKEGRERGWVGIGGIEGYTTSGNKPFFPSL